MEIKEKILQMLDTAKTLQVKLMLVNDLAYHEYSTSIMIIPEGHLEKLIESLEDELERL